jgi:predicted phage-related endonuclease
VAFEFVPTADKLAWLLARQRGVTATDVPKVLGVSRWETARHVFLDKVEPAREVPLEELPMRLRWGLRLEDDLTEEYAAVHGERPRHFPHSLARSLEYPWLLATPDRYLDEPAGQIPLELKTAADGEHWGREGTDDVPMEHFVQVAAQCVVLGAPYGRLAVVIRNDDFRRYLIEPSARVRSLVVNRSREFWGLVERDEMPPADFGHPATLALLGRMYGVEEARSVCLGAEAAAAAREYVELGRQEKELARRRNAAKARLLEEMGGAGVAHLPGGWELRRKVVSRAGYTAKPTTYPQLRVRTLGGEEEGE